MLLQFALYGCSVDILEAATCYDDAVEVNTIGIKDVIQSHNVLRDDYNIPS